MKLPSFKRITKSDFSQEEQGLIEKLSYLFNSALEVVYEALNNKLSLRDNLACSVREVQVEVDSSGTPLKNTVANFSFETGVEGVIVLNALNLNSSQIYPSAAVFVSYTIQAKSIIIKNITGLQANTPYRLKIAIFGQ